MMIISIYLFFGFLFSLLMYASVKDEPDLRKGELFRLTILPYFIWPLIAGYLAYELTYEIIKNDLSKENK